MISFNPRRVLSNVPNHGNVQPHNVQNHIKKNILAIKSLNLRDENTKDAGISKPPVSKIPVFRGAARLTIAVNQKENRVPATNLHTANVGTKPVPANEKEIIAAKSNRNQAKVIITGTSDISSAITDDFVPKSKIENIDTDSNCFLLSEYAPQIYQYLREVEEKQKLDVHFLSNKNCIAPHMRTILINWLIQVHQSFDLAAETLYICVSIVDRFFAEQAVPKTRIQLVGVTALLIAAKFEEIFYPEIGEFVSVCDSLYSKRDIIRMELTILGAIRFELGRPIPVHFLRRASKAAHADGRTHMLAKYLCEAMLIEYDAAHWKPSLTAAVALYLSLHLIAVENGSSGSGPGCIANASSPHDNSNCAIWNATIEHYTGYSKAQIVRHVPVACRALITAGSSKYQSCRRKYFGAKYMEISKFNSPQLKLIKRFAAAATSNASGLY